MCVHPHTILTSAIFGADWSGSPCWLTILQPGKYFQHQQGYCVYILYTETDLLNTDWNLWGAAPCLVQVAELLPHRGIAPCHTCADTNIVICVYYYANCWCVAPVIQVAECCNFFLHSNSRDVPVSMQMLRYYNMYILILLLHDKLLNFTHIVEVLALLIHITLRYSPSWYRLLNAALYVSIPLCVM